MEATSMSSCDGVSATIGVNVFTGFAGADGFLCMVSGGDGWLKGDVMSVGPWLLVCLPIGATLWHIAGAGWLTGLTGVGFLMVVACWISSSVNGLWSNILRLGWVLSILTPYRTHDTVDSVDFLIAMLKRVHLIPVHLWFCISGWDWWNPSLGSPVSGTKLCSLYNNKYWTANMLYQDVGTLEGFILLTMYLPITKPFKRLLVSNW